MLNDKRQPQDDVEHRRWRPGWIAGALVILYSLLAFYAVFQSIQTTNLRKDLKAEIKQIRRLNASEDWQKLAGFLDGCTTFIPTGVFLRGSDDHRWDERPERWIYLDSYEIDRYEVTNAQYRQFILATGQSAPPYWSGKEFPQGQGDFPVVGVTWEQADQYCRFVEKRLPTEAEWEKACRGPEGSIYPWGNEWEASRANLDPLAGSRLASQLNQEGSPWESAWEILRATPDGDGERGLKPVGSYLESASFYGLLDLAGNASEWVADWYAFTDYSALPDHNPQTTGPEWNHGLRGSAWYDPNGSAAWSRDQSRCSARNSSHTNRDARVGFRCARSSNK